MKNTKELKRFAGRIEMVFYTQELEVYAKNKEDANEILLNVAETMSYSDFDENESPTPEAIYEIDQNLYGNFISNIQNYVKEATQEFYAKIKGGCVKCKK